MKAISHPIWGRHLAALGFGLLGAGLSSCHSQSDPSAQPRLQATSDKELLHPTPRQRAIRDLAVLIARYHSSDFIAATDPKGGFYRSYGGRPIKYYANRAAVRVDINRLLDSLRQTGFLEIGNPANLTDTTSNQYAARASATSTLK